MAADHVADRQCAVIAHPGVTSGGLTLYIADLGGHRAGDFANVLGREQIGLARGNIDPGTRMTVQNIADRNGDESRRTDTRRDLMKQKVTNGFNKIGIGQIA
jgi:hypothetical protein